MKEVRLALPILGGGATTFAFTGYRPCGHFMASVASDDWFGCADPWGESPILGGELQPLPSRAIARVGILVGKLLQLMTGLAAPILGGSYNLCLHGLSPVWAF